MNLTIDNLKWYDIEVIRDNLMGSTARIAKNIKYMETLPEHEKDEETILLIREYVDELRSLKRALISMGEQEERIEAHIKMFGNRRFYVLDIYETLR